MKPKKVADISGDKVTLRTVASTIQLDTEEPWYQFDPKQARRLAKALEAAADEVEK